MKKSEFSIFQAKKQAFFDRFIPFTMRKVTIHIPIRIDSHCKTLPFTPPFLSLYTPKIHLFVPLLCVMF